MESCKTNQKTYEKKKQILNEVTSSAESWFPYCLKCYIYLVDSANNYRYPHKLVNIYSWKDYFVVVRCCCCQLKLLVDAQSFSSALWKLFRCYFVALFCYMPRLPAPMLSECICSCPALVACNACGKQCFQVFVLAVLLALFLF